MCGEELYLIDGSSVATVVMEILGRNGSVDHSLGSMVSSVVHVWFYLSATRYISTLFGLLPRCMLSSAFQGPSVWNSSRQEFVLVYPSVMANWCRY